jgi:hypothetical protein
MSQDCEMKKHLFLILLIFFVITGCASSKLDDPIATLQENTNNQIQLYSFDFYNTFNTSDPITAEIWNMSENSIEFPDDSNIRIFERTRKGWVEIFEKPATRIPPGPFTMNPVGESQSIRMIMTHPVLPDTGRKYDLRIYVSGLMQENGETIEVYAYTDVTLKP